ncbi:GDP-L-fucose synthase family protein [Corallincola spongiicola]|uniref:GDP-L-fucose synthase n=1 Tax=Corallincola spongiicola TaxID=2520508 RepID=A0ABY1WKB2_9GAMM|nr:GDP-L-fucose synthase [Corallincola spongiicola]TAA39597.1 GDP-L-fucose synthase [Corallincola spongiicola]
MKIFITGGRGMVGRNLSALAESTGHSVLIPARDELDLGNSAALTEYIEENSPDVIVHCAGLVGGIQANISAPYDFCHENLLIGLNLVKAARKAGVQKLINLGSSCMYPRKAENPLRESQILTGELEPTNEGYAVAKVAVARLCDYVTQQFGFSYKTLIPCNLYGYWDKFDPNHSHMIPAVIRKIDEAVRSNAEVVDIWGDGTARREFMFAEDLAEFILFALERFDDLEQYTNVGLGKDYSINEFYSAIASVIGYKGRFEHDLSKPSGMAQKLVDVTRQKKLGWMPKSGLVDGINKTYKFYLEEVL